MKTYQWALFVNVNTMIKKHGKQMLIFFPLPKITKYTDPRGRYAELSCTGMLLCSNAEQFSLRSQRCSWVYGSAAQTAKLLVKCCDLFQGFWTLYVIKEFKYNVSRLKPLQRPYPPNITAYMSYFICITCRFSFWFHFPIRPSGCAGKINKPNLFCK